MTKSNGHAELPWPSVNFRIGGRDLAVPAIGFLDMEEVEESLKALGPTIPTREYIGHVLAIVAHLVAREHPELTAEVLTRRLLAGEVSGIALTMNDLLRVSGFPMPAAVENPGTGTLTGSALASPSGESAAVILSS